MRNTHILLGKFEGKGPLRKSRRTQKDNIKIYLKENECDLDSSRPGQSSMAGFCAHGINCRAS
jgi:hypothetical protein